MTRPENTALPADLFYSNAKQYSNSSRMNVIQREIACRCLDFMKLTPQSLILDLGCGTGISGRELAANGHYWIGCDISEDMLIMSRKWSNDEISSHSNENIGEHHFKSEEFNDKENTSQHNQNNSSSQDHDSDFDDLELNKYNVDLEPLALFNLDISRDLPFKTGIFDAFVSVSCFQWLFHNRNVPESRKIVKSLFIKLRNIIKYKGKGVIQFYAQHSDHTQILIDESRKAGFYSELISDGEGKKKKDYLLLDCNTIKKIKKIKKVVDKVRAKITKMKERRIKKGLPVSRDSKYSGRKRCKKFR